MIVVETFEDPSAGTDVFWEKVVLSMTTELLEDRGSVEVDTTEVCNGDVDAVVGLKLAGVVVATLPDDAGKAFTLVDDDEAVPGDPKVTFKRCPGKSNSAPRRTTSLSRLA